MNLLIKKIGFLSLSLLIVFGLLRISVEVTQEVGRKNLYCEDGEFFTLDKEVWETSNEFGKTGDLIIVDLNKRLLNFYRNEEIFKKYTVAIGKNTTPSPVGEWKIIHKGGNWGGGFGARWLGLNVPWGIYGIHGTDKPNSIGYMSSHGCIRLHNRNVSELYNLVKMGTPVHIVGDLPKVALRKEFKLKNSGKDVLLLQFALRKAGYDPGPADARFGPGVELAVKKLQNFYGLSQSGKAGLNEQYLLGLR